MVIEFNPILNEQYGKEKLMARYYYLYPIDNIIFRISQILFVQYDLLGSIRVYLKLDGYFALICVENQTRPFCIRSNLQNQKGGFL